MSFSLGMTQFKHSSETGSDRFQDRNAEKVHEECNRNSSPKASTRPSNLSCTDKYPSYEYPNTKVLVLALNSPGDDISTHKVTSGFSQNEIGTKTRSAPCRIHERSWCVAGRGYWMASQPNTAENFKTQETENTNQSWYHQRQQRIIM